MPTVRLILLFLLVLFGVLPQTPVYAAPEPIRHFAGVRALSRENAAMGLPVELEGVVIISSNSSSVLHDGSNGIYINFDGSVARGLWQAPLPGEHLQPGTRIKIVGITDPGGFAPVVLPSRMEILGVAQLPSPVQLPMERLLSGADDGQRIVLEGVVQGLFKVSHQTTYTSGFRLMVDGQMCMVNTPFDCESLRARFDDARVRVTGVFAPTANLRSQMAGIKLSIHSLDDIHVLKEPPGDPFYAPRVELGALFKFAPNTPLYHRIVTSGVISYAVPGRFYYLQNGRSGVRVASSESGLRPGDHVEVAAFLDTSRILASLKEAKTRVIGKNTPPLAESTQIGQILHPEMRGEWEAVTVNESDFDGRLVSLIGYLRRVIIDTEREHRASVLVESEGEFFQAIIPLQDSAAEESARLWREGAKIALKGVCELQLQRTEKAGWLSIEGFQLLLASPSDLQVLHSPSWWTSTRLAIAIAGLVVVLALALVWVIVLRRQVALRGARLASEIAARESAIHEFEATLRERRRLAGDLHDSLEQALTGLALQLEAAELFRTTNPNQGAHHLQLARKFLDRSREDVRRTVWDLRTEGIGGQDLTAILRDRTASLVRGLDSVVHVSTEGASVGIPDLLAGNILLAAQEAVTNAIKHSGGTQIDVTVSYHKEKIIISVKDNGVGFDVPRAPGQNEGHFGLQGMRERLKRHGGTVKIESQSGTGTQVMLTVPIHEFPLAQSAMPI